MHLLEFSVVYMSPQRLMYYIMLLTPFLRIGRPKRVWLTHQQLVYGNFAGSFTSFSVNEATIEHAQHQRNQYTLYFVYLGMHPSGSYSHLN
jgi:hypothetical protein